MNLCADELISNSSNPFMTECPGHWACMLTALDWSSRLRTEIFTRWTCMPVMDSVLVLIFFCSSG